MKTAHVIILALALILISRPLTPEQPKPLSLPEWQTRVVQHINKLYCEVRLLQAVQHDLAQRVVSCQELTATLARTPVKYQPIIVREPVPIPIEVDTWEIESKLNQIKSELQGIRRGY